VLEAPRATANGGGGGTGGGQYLCVAGADATVAGGGGAAGHCERIVSSAGLHAGRGGLLPHDAYWAVLPAHIRNVVRTASSPQLRAAGDNERGQGPGYVRDRTANGADENKAARVKHQAKPSTAWHPSKLRSYKAMRVSAAPRAVSETEH